MFPLVQALEQVDEHLAYWPKFLLHKNKQRLTKITQYLMRMRRLQLKVRPKLVTMPARYESSSSRGGGRGGSGGGRSGKQQQQGGRRRRQQAQQRQQWQGCCFLRQPALHRLLGLPAAAAACQRPAAPLTSPATSLPPLPCSCCPLPAAGRRSS